MNAFCMLLTVCCFCLLLFCLYVFQRFVVVWRSLFRLRDLGGLGCLSDGGLLLFCNVFVCLFLLRFLGGCLEGVWLMPSKYFQTYRWNIKFIRQPLGHKYSPRVDYISDYDRQYTIACGLVYRPIY